MEIIKSFDEEQLFVKKLYKWTGNSLPSATVLFENLPLPSILTAEEIYANSQSAHLSNNKYKIFFIILSFIYHKLFIDWANDNTKGIDRDFLPKPYNWRTYPQMNVEIWKKHQNTSLEDARKIQI